MQEHILEEKLKGLLIHSCKSVDCCAGWGNTALILELAWEWRDVSFQGFPLFTAEMAGNLIKSFRDIAGLDV